MFWRFLPLGDPTVQRFLSRDLDALVLEREVAAVHEWLESGRQFHIIRDNANHNTAIVAGLWGVDNYKNISK